MDIYAELASNIIKAQKDIVGPVAIEQAKRVTGLKLSDSKVEIVGDKKSVVEQLVRQYEGLFGQASIEVCKNAVRNLQHNLSKDQLPSLLQ